MTTEERIKLIIQLGVILQLSNDYPTTKEYGEDLLKLKTTALKQLEVLVKTI